MNDITLHCAKRSDLWYVTVWDRKGERELECSDAIDTWILRFGETEQASTVDELKKFGIAASSENTFSTMIKFIDDDSNELSNAVQALNKVKEFVLKIHHVDGAASVTATRTLRGCSVARIVHGGLCSDQSDPVYQEIELRYRSMVIDNELVDESQE